ncbi:hypothetical protein ACW6QP_00010 [Salegentibacter sp. HM20]
MKKIIFILLGLVVIGCQDKNSGQDTTEQIDSTGFNKQIELPAEQVILVPEARKYAIEWLAYITAQNEIDNFRGADVNYIKENSKPLVQIMQNLKSSLPDSLKSKAVESRINVLLTKTRILDQVSSMRNPNPDHIVEAAGDIPGEWNNFKLQLNELFLKTLEDFERELDEIENQRRNQSRDSLELPEISI